MIELTHAQIELMKMSILKAQMYRCGNQSCNPFYNTTTSNVRRCQMICMAHRSCSISSFRQSTKQCELYYSAIKSNATIISDSDTVTMVAVVDERKYFGKATITSYFPNGEISMRPFRVALG